MHNMIDIETLGTLPGSVITQLGLAKFSEEHGIQVIISQHIELKSCLDAGLVIDQSSLHWRFKENLPFYTHSKTVVPLKAALGKFFSYIEKDELTWADPVNFDLPLLEVAAARVGLQVPWHRQNTRDARSFPFYSKSELKRETAPHDAADDAIHQARCLVAAMGSLRGALIYDPTDIELKVAPKGQDWK
jgi:hypothetical protein